MRKGTKIGLIVGSVIVVIAMIFVCMAIVPRNTGAPTPEPTFRVEETEDCDREDRAKRDVQDCGFGVLIQPNGSPTPRVVDTPNKPKPACTRTATRRCR